MERQKGKILISTSEGWPSEKYLKGSMSTELINQPRFQDRQKTRFYCNP